MAMRVLQLGPYPPPHGGVQYNLVAIHEYLLEQNISSEIINLTRFRKQDAGGVYYPGNWFELLMHLLRLRYDIIHLHIGGALTSRLLGLSFICCMMPRSKAVLTFHSGGYPGSKEGKTARPGTLRGFVFRRFDRIIGVNPQIVELFQAFGVKRERVGLIYPYDLPDRPPDVPMPEPLSSFIKEHHPLLATVGLLEPEYDLPLQIDVLGLVREKHPEAGLIIIGSGSIEEELRANIESKRYAKDILLCGDIPNPVTLNVIGGCDLFLRTTLYDGDAISVREALHFGSPVIATDTGMRPDGVDLFPYSDLEALRAAIESRLEKPVSRATAERESSDNIAAVFELYRELAER